MAGLGYRKDDLPSTSVLSALFHNYIVLFAHAIVLCLLSTDRHNGSYGREDHASYD
jgi:hypothetical protein